jgi:predicted permease
MTTRPRLAARLLEWWLPAADRDEIIGDLDEECARRLRTGGARQVRRWYWVQTVDLVRRYRRSSGPRAGPSRGGRGMIGDDVRHVMRRFRARPAVVLAATAMLAAALGLSTSTFAVLDSLVLERAPFQNPESLRTVAIRSTYGSDNPELIRLIRAWRDASAFEAVESAGVQPLAGTSSTSALVTPGLFRLLGAGPVRGRAFTDEDARPGGVEPVLISERLWRDGFGADPSRLGGVIAIDGREYRLIGVMPADFRFPEWNTVMWRPLSLDTTPFPAAAGRYSYVRLPRGIPEADVMARATRIAGEADARFTARPNALAAWPIGGAIDDHAGRAIPLFAGAVGLIFLSLCANASTLLLAEMATRRRELGIRLSLGASRTRLLRESVLEHAVIGAAGIVAGIAIASALTRLLPSILSEGFSVSPSLNPINVDPRALAMAAGLGFVAVLLSGVLPAWMGTRLEPSLSIKPGERTHTESRSSRATTRTLLVAQVAFASMLILGATLLIRSFDRMANADRGMNASGLYRMAAFMSSVTPAVLDDLEARIAALPGVEGVTVDGTAPPEAGGTVTARWRSDRVDAEFPMYLYEVRSRFFDFYGIRLLKGRQFQPGDTNNVAIVGERVAALLWPDQDPLGKTMSMERGPLQLQVIGVAREISLPSLFDRVDLPEIYIPYSGRRSVVTIGWRCSAACPDRQQLRARLREVDPGANGLDVTSVEARYARQLLRPRAAAELGATFAVVAVATSAAGLFAVLSFTTSRRRREFGIRTALGATPAMLRRGVSGDAARIAAAGAVIGGFCAWMLKGPLESVSYGIPAADPATWLAMIATVALTAVVASWRPSRQAARVDPVQLLREE